MSSKSWKEFLLHFASITRTAYEVELVKEGVDPEKLIELLDLPAIQYALPKPCQITVFEFSSTPRIIWLFTFEKSKADMYLKVEKVRENVEDFLESHSEYGKYAWGLNVVSINGKDLKVSSKEDYVSLGAKDYFGIMFFSNPMFKFTSRELALRIFSENKMWVLRSIQQSKIARSTSEILDKVEETEGAKAISLEVKSIREALDKLKKIDDYDQKLVSIEDNLLGVRKLVGTQTFGEWKVLLSEIDKMNTRIDAFSEIKDAYDKVLAQQNEFMKQQAEVIRQQSSFIKWIKYATILLPIAVISVPVIEIISVLVRHLLGIP